MSAKLKSFLQTEMSEPYRRLQEISSRVRVRYVTRLLVARSGLIVQDGPFGGMRYVPEAVGSNLTPKLLGSYESELQSTLDLIVAGDYRTVIDVGCAEGYYAIGLALKLPSATVHAFDINSRARELCKEMARVNMVSDRVSVHGECSHEILRTLAKARTLIVCDCEGCELELLQPLLVPGFSDCNLLVELHELLVPGLTHELTSRFSSTHNIQLINSREPDPTKYPVLKTFSRLNQRVAVSEFRDGPMQWAWMTHKRSTS